MENVRVRGGRVVQRHVLYLGEINDNQRAAWCRSIEVVEGTSGARQMALFPEDREAPELACEVVRIAVKDVELRDPRQWGGLLAGPGAVGSPGSGPLLGSAPAPRAGRAHGGWIS